MATSPLPEPTPARTSPMLLPLALAGIAGCLLHGNPAEAGEPGGGRDSPPHATPRDAGGDARDGSFLRKGETWVVSGDSITSTDTYRQLLQLAADHFHPGAGIRLMNTAVWGQLAEEAKGQGMELHPTLVSILLGMNNVIHHEYGSEPDFGEIRRRFRETIVAQVRAFRATGADVILATPTLTDEREGAFFVTYNATAGLRLLGEDIREIAREEGCHLLPLAEDLEEFQRTLGPRETLRPDGVHPYGGGQYAIAESFIRRLRFAGELGGDRRLSDAPPRPPAASGASSGAVFSRPSPFLGPEGLRLGTGGARGRARWSVWTDAPRIAGDAAAGAKPSWACRARGDCLLDGAGEWTLPAPPDALGLAPGERARVLVDFPGDGDAGLLHVCDLARVPVVHADADGAFRREILAGDGSRVAGFSLRVVDGQLWLEGRCVAPEFPPPPPGVWANVFQMNGLQFVFDFRPPERFAGLNVDRDAPMVLFSAMREPRWAAMPLLWLGRRYQNALFADAGPTGDGWEWTLGFRGNVTDREPFDLSGAAYIGLHAIVARIEDGKAVRYADLPFLPFENPETRMNQPTVYDLAGTLPGDAATTVTVFPPARD